MRLGYMFKEAVRALLSRPVTVQSVTKGESVPVPERYRGMIEYDREACIGCLMCGKTCPTGTILNTEAHKVEFRMDRCVFCGACADICPKDAIKMSSKSEIITRDRKQLLVK